MARTLNVPNRRKITESPAAKADIRVGDELLTIGDAWLTSLEGGLRFATIGAGESVRLALLRHGRVLEVEPIARDVPTDGKLHRGD